MENNKNKKSVKFQGDMLNFCDFILVFVFTTNHHLKMSTFVGILAFMSRKGIMLSLVEHEFYDLGAWYEVWVPFQGKHIISFSIVRFAFGSQAPRL